MKKDQTVIEEIYTEGTQPIEFDGYYFVFKNRDKYTFNINPQEHEEQLIRPDGSEIRGTDSEVWDALTSEDRKLRIDDFIMNARHFFPLEYWKRDEGTMNEYRFTLVDKDFIVRHYTKSDKLIVKMPFKQFEAPRPIFGDLHHHLHKTENGKVMDEIAKHVAFILGDNPLPTFKDEIELPKLMPKMTQVTINGYLYKIAYDYKTDYLIVETPERTITSNLLILKDSEIEMYKIYGVKGYLKDAIIRKINIQKEKRENNSK